MNTMLMRPLRLDLDSFARACGTDPEYIRRLVALGLIDADRDASGRLWFLPAQVRSVGRIRRLRAAFPLNYASLGLVCELLDRIAALESAVRQRSRRLGDRSWT
jgi:chaperone modulatory protein CbpM